jgi:hypothetical protein
MLVASAQDSTPNVGDDPKQPLPAFAGRWQVYAANLTLMASNAGYANAPCVWEWTAAEGRELLLPTHCGRSTPKSERLIVVVWRPVTAQMYSSHRVLETC